MPSIITNNQRTFNASNFEDSLKDEDLYLFFSKQTAWDDEAIPDFPLDTTSNLYQVYNDMISLKKIEESKVSSVVPRYDWEESVVFDQYDDEKNLVLDTNDGGGPLKYYVLTDDFNVYKCISNNNGAVTSDKPLSTGTAIFTTGDGYIWKYMYSLNSTDVESFLTDDWMPVRTLLRDDSSSQWTVQQAAVNGAINFIEVTTAGSNYNHLNPPIVTITGDGSGATAVAVINPSTTEMSGIVVIDPGADYSYANITINASATTGSGAVARSILSPIGGHGADAKRELGSVYKMIKATAEGNEGGNFPVGISYRQIGLIKAPLSSSQGSILDVVIDEGSIFEVGDTITGVTSSAEGTLVKYNHETGFMHIDTEDNFTSSESISNAAGETATVTVATNSTEIALTSLSALASTIKPFSGEILYINNKIAIERITNQTESFRLILSF